MNYLAHFHLAANDQHLIVGALLGDYVKGPLSGCYGPSLEKGIILHRKLDAFTDQHPSLIGAIREFPPEFRRFGGIMLDVFFDHLLTCHWKQFHSQPLQEFAEHVYLTLDEHHQILPDNAKRFALRMAQHDLLNQYDKRETIERAFYNISHRLTRKNPLNDATEVLYHHYNQLEALFLTFYPQAKVYADAVSQRCTTNEVNNRSST